MSEKEMNEFIEAHVSKVRPLFRDVQLASWDAYLTGKKEFYDKSEEISLEIEKIYNSKSDFEKVKKWHSLEIKDELIKRQIDKLYRSFLSSQGDISLIKAIIGKQSEIERKFNIYRAVIDGKEYTDNELLDILKTEKDSEKLKAAWEANKKQGALVEKDVLELVKLRNKLAKQLGFDNYYVFSLEASEQKPEEIKQIFSKLAELSNKKFAQVKDRIDSYLSDLYGISKTELKPWHYHGVFFQEAPKIHKINLDKFYKKDIIEIAKKYYSLVGLPVESILERSDLYEKKGKYQHACCMDLDREGDVRIIENVKNNEKWMDTTMHELGHAVYDLNVEMSLPFLLRGHAHIFATEAVAMFFERNSKNINFIRKFTGSKPADSVSDEIHDILALDKVVFSRWAQVMVNFERQMYENPEQDLNKLWYSLVQKYQLINFSRDMPDWASKIHLASCPVYYHNYLLGELLASQFNHHIAFKVLNLNSIKNMDYADKKLGDYFKNNVFSVGSRYRWDEMIKRATGESLNPKYFVEEWLS